MRIYLILILLIIVACGRSQVKEIQPSDESGLRLSLHGSFDSVNWTSIDTVDTVSIDIPSDKLFRYYRVKVEARENHSIVGTVCLVTSDSTCVKYLITR